MSADEKVVEGNFDSPYNVTADLKAKRGKKSRSKGQTAERELFGLLSERLGTVVSRNLSQTRGGGADTLDIPGWSLEVKRWESTFREAWWEQAVEQAWKAGRKPALAYRASRQPWRFRTNLIYSDPSQSASSYWVETDIDGFCFMVRETI